MLQPSSRLGYYVISLGIALQVLGLAGDSWTRDPGATNDAFLAMSNPSHVLLLIGLVTIILGTLLGFLGLSQELASAPAHEARLLPALPLVLLVGVSLGSATFAYQTGNASTATNVQARPAQGFVVAQPGPNDCPEGTYWHPDMGHCMIPSALGVDGTPAAPICPTDYVWSTSANRCISEAASAGRLFPGGEQSNTSAATPDCPSGTVWHEDMGHCMSTVCPAGYQWDGVLFSCGLVLAPNETQAPNATPACPSGYFWHPDMDHCMSNSCPTGYQWDWTYLTCLQVAGPPPATSTPGPRPSQTPRPSPTPLAPMPTPTPDSRCPSGFVWDQDEGHCESTTCPPGMQFDWDTLHCALPSKGPTQGPTATPTPACPEGFFWHPAMGHCMSSSCPPGLVMNWDTGYCELPQSVGQTPVATTTPSPTPALPGPTSTPAPSCPDGYFWHPAMGHCMSESCPPGLVLDRVTGYCVLP